MQVRVVASDVPGGIADDEAQRMLLSDTAAAGIEPAPPVDLNHDTYSLPVALYMHSRPWPAILLAAALGVFIAISQLLILKWYVNDVMFRTVIDTDALVRWMHWFFVLLNWASFQVPASIHALKLLELDLWLSKFFGALSLFSASLAAYFSAALIRAATSPRTVVTSFLALRVAMSFDETVMQGIIALLRYYLGPDWVDRVIQWKVQRGSRCTKGDRWPAVLLHPKSWLPGFLLVLSLLRFAETREPLDYVFPLSQQKYQSQLFTTVPGLSYTPRTDGEGFGDFLSQRCADEHWFGEDGMPRLPASGPFVAAAERVSPMLSRAGMVCQPKYALVPEPVLVPWLLNGLARLLPPLAMAPSSGRLRSKYIPAGWPGNRGGDRLGLPSCGVCEANGMLCIPFEHADCTLAASLLRAAPVPGPAAAAAVRQAAQVLRPSGQAAGGPSPMQSLVALLGQRMCHGRPLAAMQRAPVRTHICELPPG